MDSNQSDQQQHQTNNNNRQSESNNNRSVQEQSSTEEGHSHQPPPPVSPEHHPGAAGYAAAPPEIRYPYPPPHNYQGYPPLPPNYVNQANYHPHAQAPPAPYYYANPNNVNRQNYPSVREAPSFRFLRAILVLVMILLILDVTFSCVTILVYLPQVPTFHVNAFSVSNFNASSPSGVASTWDVTLSVKNRNTKLKANFEGADTHLYYHYKNVLASSFIQPFEMEAGEVTNLTIRMEAGTGGDATVVAKDVVAEMEDEKAATGAVVFQMSVSFDTLLNSGYYSKSYLLDVDCNTLRVLFGANGSSINGSLDYPRKCDLFGYE